MIFLRYLLEMMSVFPAAILAILPVRDYRRHRRTAVYTTAAAVLLCYVILGSLIAKKTGIRTNTLLFPVMVVFYILYDSFYELSRGKKLFCFFNSSMICASATLFTTVLTAPLELETKEQVFLPESSGICLGLTIFMILVFFRTLIVKIPELLDNSYLDKIWLPLSLLPAMATMLFVWATPVSPETVMTGRVRPISLVMFGLIMGLILLLYHVFWWIARQVTRNAELESVNRTFQMEQRRYEELRKYLDETRTLRHDFRQHVILLQHYLDEGDLESLRSSLREYTVVSSGTRSAYCGNRTMDAVIAHYAAMAEKQAIVLSLSLYLPELLPVTVTDLCVVLGNLLENAIHAVSKLPPGERSIKVHAKLLTEEMLGITVSNPYSGEVRLDRKGIPRSDRLHHGIGLRSVVKTVEQYQGNIQFQTENGRFQVSLTMFGRRS